MFHTNILSLQNASKQTNSMILQNELAHQNPDKMNTNEHFKNHNFAFLGLLLQNA